MDERVYEIVTKVLTEKINLLEWQLKDAEERNRKLKDEVADLKAEIERLKKLIGEAEEEENV